MKNSLKVFLFLWVCGLLLFSNSLNNKFLIDDYFFLSNPVLSHTKFILSQWDPYQEQAMGVIDRHESFNYYRPLQNMVMAFCYPVFKNHYWQYHLLNLFLVVTASSLIYLLIEKLTGNYVLALLTALFYLIHPINGIIVNYISASVFAFQVIFVLSAILLLWEALKRRDQFLYLLSLLVSFLSLFWHESGIMIAFYISAVIFLFRNDPLRQKWLNLSSYFIVVFSYIFFRFLFVSVNESILKQVTYQHLSILAYAANLFRALMWYTQQLFWPNGVVMAWTSPLFHDHLLWYASGAGLLVVLFLFLFIRLAKEKILQMALIWIMVGFAPVCVAVFRRPDNGVQIEPHWFVISSIGFFILAAYFCLTILNYRRGAGSAFLFILVFAWGAVSHANNRLWFDQKTYARYWIQKVPNLKSAYYYLANAYQQEGSLTESQKYYRLALAGYSSDLEIYNNLGVIYQAQGHLKEAESNYQKVLAIDPDLAGTYYNLGYLYYTKQEFNRAQEYFDRALALNPLLMEPRRGLAYIALIQGGYQKAIHLCLKNLDIKNDDLATLWLLAGIFIQTKDFINVKRYAYQAINIDPAPESLTRWGIIMAQNNIPVTALDCFEKAIRLNPDYMDAYLAAGTLFANVGKYDQAVHIWKAASSINPSDQRFKNAITKIMTLRLK